MVFYDDKTSRTIKSGSRVLIPNIEINDDITFKASYVISSDLKCTGKISALFDLIVFGNVQANEIDIKGRFVCLGQCCVDDSIVVQDDIWCEDVQANSIICHDRIVAQSIDADTVIADGSIIVGKTLSIVEKAKTYQNVICGETAYGAGKIIASTILTAEPLDLDEGEEALETPFEYSPKASVSGNTELSKESVRYSLNNDYTGYLKQLLLIPNDLLQKKLNLYLTVLKTVDAAFPSHINELRDASLLIWLIEISQSEYFKEWNSIMEWTNSLLDHFQNMAKGELTGLHEPKSAKELCKGYIVLHQKYGRGIVRIVERAVVKGKMSYLATVDFDGNGEKKFPLPDALKFFLIMSESKSPSADELRASIQCNINNYSEWLTALQIINQYREYMGNPLYEVLYGLLLGKLGLKPKYVEDRLKGKGWN